MTQVFPNCAKRVECACLSTALGADGGKAAMNRTHSKRWRDFETSFCRVLHDFDFLRRQAVKGVNQLIDFVL
jgi:hypothetical protein